MAKPAFKRILLKLSGEALQGTQEFGIDPKVLDRIANEVRELVDMGVQVAMVIGGGNLFRGAELSEAGIGRVTGDHMGMLATVMNGLALRDALERATVRTRVMSAVPVRGIVQPYDRRKAMALLNDGATVIFTAGTGNPFFTTDTAASLRAVEVGADILLKGTKVDGIFSADPVVEPSATLYPRLTYQEVLQQELGVMDLTAICLVRDHNMPLRVFNMNKTGALRAVVMGEAEGTLVERD